MIQIRTLIIIPMLISIISHDKIMHAKRKIVIYENNVSLN